MKKIILYVTCCLLIQACVKDADIKIPNQEPFIVTHCYISPDDTVIRAKVYLSQPLYKSETNSFIPVNDANVEISNGTNSITLNYNSVLKHYEVKASIFKIQSNKTYKLTVKTSDGKLAYAFTNVPSNYVTCNKLKYDSIKLIDKWQRYVEIDFIDDANDKNYYAFSYGEKFLVGNDTLIQDYPNEKLLREDGFFNGTNHTETIDIKYTKNDIVGYKVFLLNVTKDYYEYFNSIKNSSIGGAFSEPTLIYTNFTNGLGIFAGYTRLDANLKL